MTAFTPWTWPEGAPLRFDGAGIGEVERQLLGTETTSQPTADAQNRKKQTHTMSKHESVHKRPNLAGRSVTTHPRDQSWGVCNTAELLQAAGSREDIWSVNEN